MSFELRRVQHLAGASLLLLGAAATSALAQEPVQAPVQQPAQDKSSTEIPAVTVTAPSPIVRRVVPTRSPVRVARSGRSRSQQHTAEAAPPAAIAAAAPQQGVLPVVTNQFTTVTVANWLVTTGSTPC